MFIFVLSVFVFFMSNYLGDSDNYIIRKKIASYCQNELLATNHQIIGESLKLFQPNKTGNISYGTGNDSWYGKIDTDYHNI